MAKDDEPKRNPGLEAVRLLVAGNPRYDIAEYLAAEFGIKNVDELIAEAFEAMIIEAVVDLEDIDAVCLAYYRELYRSMFEIGDFAGARQVVDQMVKLTPRVDGNRRVKPTGKGKLPAAKDGRLRLVK